MPLDNTHTNFGFKAPKDYFENFDNALQSKLKLEHLKHNSGFKAPEHYFNTLENNILHKIQIDHKEKFSVKPLYYTISAIAAILIIALFSITFNTTTSTTTQFNTIQLSSIEAYLDDNAIHDTDIAEIFTETSNYSFNITLDNPDLILDYLDNTIEDTYFLTE